MPEKENQRFAQLFSEEEWPQLNIRTCFRILKESQEITGKSAKELEKYQKNLFEKRRMSEKGKPDFYSIIRKENAISKNIRTSFRILEETRITKKNVKKVEEYQKNLLENRRMSEKGKPDFYSIISKVNYLKKC